jgi:hypothetical protein
MDEEPIGFLQRERQTGEEIALRAIEAAPRPFDRHLRSLVHPLTVRNHRGIVIAEDGCGAACDIALYRFERLARIGTVADVIAEKDVALRLAAFSVAEAGRQGLAVRMNVRQERDEHRSKTGPCHAC